MHIQFRFAHYILDAHSGGAHAISRFPNKNYWFSMNDTRGFEGGLTQDNLKKLDLFLSDDFAVLLGR
jgi:hypothetical protein